MNPNSIPTVATDESSVRSSWQDIFENWLNTPDENGVRPADLEIAPEQIWARFAQEDGEVVIPAILTIGGCLFAIDWFLNKLGGVQNAEDLEKAEQARIAQGGNPKDNKWNF